MTTSVKNMVLSGNAGIDGLLSGYPQWTGDITFSIATAASVWPDYPASGSFPTQPEYAIPSQQQSSAIRTAMATWQSYIAAPLTEVADNATSSGEIRVAFSLDPTRPTASLGTYPGDGVGGDIWLGNRAVDAGATYEVGSGYYFALMHEIGHALGLKHTFEGTPMNATTLDTQHSVRMYSIMAYENVVGQPLYGTTFFATTPMVYDIRAIQYLYGKNTTTHAGDTTYQFAETGAYNQTIYDAGGTNAIVYSGKKAATINLNEGEGSYIGQENWILDYGHNGQKVERIPNVWIAYGTQINNATGGDGDDILIGNAGDNHLVGGAGIDTAVYTGKFADYAIQIDKASATVSGAAGVDGTDALSGVERLRFSDATVALDIDGNAGQAYRIYQAVFNRAPDSAGLGYWINAMDHGASLKQIATSFIASAEFATKYGANPSNASLVSNFYSNVLHRTPDAGGSAFWLNILDSHAGNAADVLASFSESAENQAALIGVIGHGIAYTPYG